MSEYVSAKAARLAEEEKNRREKKKYTITVSIIVAVVVLLVIFTILFSSNLFYNVTTAVSAGPVKYSAADFNYNYSSIYNSFYSSYGSLAQYILPSGTSLRETAYFADDSMTWAEYFEGQALNRMQEVALLTTEAEKEGFTLTDEEKTAVEDTIESLRTQSATNGFASLEQYLVYVYGKGMTEKIFRENLQRDALASSYSAHKADSFTFTDEEIGNQYTTNANDYDYYTFRLYNFSGAAVTDNEETEEDETVSAEDAMAKAKADADEFVANVTDDAQFVEYAATLNESASYDADSSTIRVLQGSSLSSDIKDWVVDSARKEGDIAAVKTADDSTSPGYNVILFINREDNNYPAVKAYYGIVANDSTITEDSFDSHDAYVEALQSKAETDANTVLEKYTSGSDKGYDAFSAVMNDNTDTLSGTGDLASIGKHDLPEAVSAWLFDESRKEGDTAAIYDEDNGCFILYYNGTEGVYADLIAESALRSDAYTSWEEEAVKDYAPKTGWEMSLTKKITALGG